MPEAEMLKSVVPEAAVPEAAVPKAAVPKADMPKSVVPNPDLPEADIADAVPRRREEPTTAMRGAEATEEAGVAATIEAASARLPGEPDEASLRLAEAAVFASVTPMTARALSQILPDDIDPAAVIVALRQRYQGRGIELSEVAGGLRFRTARDLAPGLRKVLQVPRKLPRVTLETLAIIAYHQPITRPEIEDMRGAGLAQQTLETLLDNDLIAARGRKETPGRPTLWGTTSKFLEYFGLRDIRDLPRRQDLLLETVRPEAQAEAQPNAAASAPE